MRCPSASLQPLALFLGSTLLFVLQDLILSRLSATSDPVQDSDLRLVNMEVRRAKKDDVEPLQRLFSAAIARQKAMRVPTFTEFSDLFLEGEIGKGAVFVADEAGNITGTISVYETDEIIWGSDGETALYIHRLASAHTAAGRGTGAALVKWARARAFAAGKQWLRVDCWAENENLVQFYLKQGFGVVRDEGTGTHPSLPPHYHHIQLRLFQMPAEGV